MHEYGFAPYRVARLSLESGCDIFFFFFQAEDGIRDYKVTGVQTCALPIYLARLHQPSRLAAAATAQPPPNCSSVMQASHLHPSNGQAASSEMQRPAASIWMRVTWRLAPGLERRGGLGRQGFGGGRGGGEGCGGA